MKHTIILLHGAWHGAWCWQALTEQLQPHYNVVALDLPGHGDNPSIDPPTLQDYFEYVSAEVLAHEGKVTLVAHSFAGTVATCVASQLPKKINALIYISAVLPRNNQAFMEVVANNPSTVGAAMQFSPDYIEFDKTQAEHFFYHDCNARDRYSAIERLVAEPAQPFSAVINIDEAVINKLQKHYIICENDRALLPEFQRLESEEYENIQTISIATGHSPFLAKPVELAKLITSHLTLQSTT